jgi:hypothetical protein
MEVIPYSETWQTLTRLHSVVFLKIVTAVKTSKLTRIELPISCKRLDAGSPPRWSGFESRSGHVGFIVDKVALRQVFSKYSGFPYNSFHRLLHTHHHPLSGVATIDQIVADVPSGLSLTPQQETKKQTCMSRCQIMLRYTAAKNTM